MKVHKIPCDSEFRAYALIRQIFVYFHLII